MRDDVTVVVPVFNGEATIGACLTSILAARPAAPSTRVVVVDNASTDGTRQVLAQFGSQIDVASESTPGAAAARNAGIRAATSPIVAFTDADCVVEPGWIAALARPLADRSVGVAGGRILSVAGANRIARFGDTIHDHRRAIEVEVPPYTITMNWASRREVLLNAGSFDERLLRGQDVDLAWRIGASGHRLVYVHDAVVRHHNETTLWALAREGYVHGYHGVRLAAKHGLTPAPIRRLWRSGQRLGRSAARLLRPSSFVDGALGLTFHIGKGVGELHAVARGPRA